MRFLRTVALVAGLCAAADTVVTRFGLPHRPTEIRLFVEAFGLWALFALVAWVPAQITARSLSKSADPAGWTRGLCLLGWTALPVLAHATLDRYTSIGADTAALRTARPWIELVGVVGGGIALLTILARAFAARVQGAGLGAWALSLGMVAAVGCCLPWTDGRFEAVATSGPSDAAEDAGDASADPPNLLLMIWDTARAQSLSAVGGDRPTSPHLEEFAANALVYDNARSVTIFTFTSHLSMLTGEYPSGHGARLLDARYRPQKAESIAETLRQQGYRTGAFVGTGVLGSRTGVSWGFEVFEDRVDPHVCDTSAWKLVHDLQSVGARTIGALRFHGRPHWIEDFQRPADEVLAGARAWIEEDDPRPWFCFINMYDVHWPYLPGEEAQEHLLDDYSGPFTGFGTRSNDLYRTGYAPTTEDKRHLTELYEAEIWELDRQVAAFLEAIDVQNGRTGVVLTSDHGEAFGEADVWEHDDIYEPQVRIPLIVRGPGLNPPRGRVSEYVSGVDVAPTLLGMAGVEIPAAWPGLDLLSEAPSAERIILVEDRDHMEVDDVRLALYRGNFKLQREGCGEDAKVRLYDLSSDPIAERDISRRHPELTAELLGELERRSGAFDCSEGERISGTISGGNAAALSGLGYAGDGSEPKPERRRQEAPDDEVDPPPAPPAGGR